MKKFRFKSLEEKQIEELQDENADLLFKNAIQDATIQALQDENSEIIFKIAQMEVGGVVYV